MLTDNKRIAKNTIILYIRMAFLMLLSLYTSRIILQALGVEDFGIYNIVGSVIVMFGFLNNALTQTTRRFLNYYLGSDKSSSLNTLFASLITVHLLVSIAVFVLGETLGVWFLNNQLNIPESRMFAANWVLQISIVSTCIGIVFSPYEGAIVANERFSVYAMLSLVEAVGKFILIVALLYCNADRLIVYAVTLFLLSMCMLAIKLVYCRRHFSYCRLSTNFSKAALKPLISFSTWSLFGQMAYIGSTTGLNMVVNVFYGVTVNAAIGIATQINTAIYNFASNFQSAFNPQLVQTFASNDTKAHGLLVSRSTRLSYYLLIVISLPVVFNIDTILHIWLTEVPDYTAIFAILIIVASLLEALGTPLWMSMQATGNIRTYQLLISLINGMTIPALILFFSWGYPPQTLFWIKIAAGVVIYVFRIVYVLPRIHIKRTFYLRQDIIPIITTTALTVGIMAMIQGLADDKLLRLVLCCIVSVVVTPVFIYGLGISSAEKTAIRAIIANKLRK